MRTLVVALVLSTASLADATVQSGAGPAAADETPPSRLDPHLRRVVPRLSAVSPAVS